MEGLLSARPDQLADLVARPDTLSFAGIGTWSANPGDHSHVATVQVSTSKQFPYVTIMIDGGRTQSVNTKPANVDDTMP